MATFWEQTDKGIAVRIRLTPNAARAGFCGLFTDAEGKVYLKASVVSVPEKGKANQELIKLLSRCLKTAKSAIKIISGETDRLKKILLTSSQVTGDDLEKLGTKNDREDN